MNTSFMVSRTRAGTGEGSSAGQVASDVLEAGARSHRHHQPELPTQSANMAAQTRRWSEIVKAAEIKVD